VKIRLLPSSYLCLKMGSEYPMLSITLARWWLWPACIKARGSPKRIEPGMMMKLTWRWSQSPHDTKWTTVIYATSINRDWLTKVAIYIRRTVISHNKVNNRVVMRFQTWQYSVSLLTRWSLFVDYELDTWLLWAYIKMQNIVVFQTSLDQAEIFR